MAQKQPPIVILTALPVEYKVVRDHFPDLQEVVHPQGTVYEQGVFPTANGQLQIVIGVIGMGNEAAALETERVIQYFKPNILLFVGVAGGIKDVELDDIVVGTKVYQYESGKAKTIFLQRPDVFNAAYKLVQRAQAEARKDNWLLRIKKTLPTSTRRPSVLVGPIAAGEKVIASTRASVFKFISNHYSDAIAVEMEGHGFLKAIHANPNVEGLIIRGISDLIDGKQASDDDIHQTIAAQNATAFAFEVLANIESPGKVLGQKRQQPRKPIRQIVYELKLPKDTNQQVGALHGWRFLELPVPQTIVFSEDTISTGTINSTTFHRAPSADMLNCSVECEIRIIEHSDDLSRWAGIRLRGLHDDIRFGYLVYLRAVGTVELYRAGEVLKDSGKYKSGDTKNQWTHLRVDLLKNRIRVWMKGKLCINVADKMFGEKGSVFIHTFGTQAEFRNLKIFRIGQ